MIPSFVITLREILEAAIIIGIILSYLSKSGQAKYNKIVYFGIAAAIAASIGGAYMFERFAGRFSGRAEEIFEWVVMLVGTFLLTTMIFWMMRRRNAVEKLEHNVEEEVSSKHIYGLFSLVFVSVLREGIETVVFLKAASIITGSSNLTGALLGIITAIGIGYAIFVGTQKIIIKKFFTATGVLLILFAAGLTAHGVHELQEAHIVPTIVEHVWDVNPAVISEGVYHLLHEKGYIGSIFKGLFGYNGNPSLIEVMSYALYISLAAFLWKKSYKPKPSKPV